MKIEINDKNIEEIKRILEIETNDLIEEICNMMIHIELNELIEVKKRLEKSKKKGK